MKEAVEMSFKGSSMLRILASVRNSTGNFIGNFTSQSEKNKVKEEPLCTWPQELKSSCINKYKSGDASARIATSAECKVLYSPVHVYGALQSLKRYRYSYCTSGGSRADRRLQ